MDAKSGNGRSGTFIWGMIAGLIALFGVSGLYLSGMLGGNPETGEPVAKETAPAPEVEVTQETSDVTPDVAEPEVAAVEPMEEAEPDAPAEQADNDGALEPTEQAADAPVDGQTEEPEPVEEATVTALPPVLDQIFVEKDGNALLSGNAEPGSQLDVLLDGERVHSFTVGTDGQFAEFVTIPFSDQARGLVLADANGAQSARSDDYLIAALPEPAPAEPEEQVASAEGAGDTETAATDGLGTEAAEEGTQTVAAADQEVPPVSEPETEVDASDDQQVAVLRSGEEGVELVQLPSAQPDEPEQIALDTIGYSDTGDVQLTGRVKDGAAVRLYLNNRLVADFKPDDDGTWRGDIDGIEPGVYTLRVDEVDTDGTVLSRLETPFKREPVEVLQIAEAEPANGESPQPTPSIRSVTVQKGDTLWAISRERFGDGVFYVKLFDANRKLIRNPDLIYPGQVFTIPE